MERAILPILSSCRASPPFGWYSFPVLHRVVGWVGLGGLLKYRGCLTAEDGHPSSTSCGGRESNSRPSSRKSNDLTARLPSLPSHHRATTVKTLNRMSECTTSTFFPAHFPSELKSTDSHKMLHRAEKTAATKYHNQKASHWRRKRGRPAGWRACRTWWNVRWSLRCCSCPRECVVVPALRSTRASAYRPTTNLLEKRISRLQ